MITRMTDHSYWIMIRFYYQSLNHTLSASSRTNSKYRNNPRFVRSLSFFRLNSRQSRPIINSTQITTGKAEAAETLLSTERETYPKRTGRKLSEQNLTVCEVRLLRRPMSSDDEEVKLGVRFDHINN